MPDIRFHLRREDLVAFAQYHADHSRDLLRTRRRQVHLWPLLFLCTGLLASSVHADRRFLWGAAGVALTWWLTMPWILRGLQRRRSLRHELEETNRTLLGDHHYAADGPGLTVLTKEPRPPIHWMAIDRTAATPSHLFLYLTQDTALIVPRHNITHGDFDQFRDFVTARTRPANP